MWSVAVLLIFISSSSASMFKLFSGDVPYDGLRVTWGINLFDEYVFAPMPRTVPDAVAQGFTKNSDCSNANTFRGQRYLINNDPSMMLLYCVNGYIAGIQASVPANQSNHFPGPALQGHPLVLENNRWIITVYFTDPSTICTTGRSADEFKTEGTGNYLYIQNGTVPEQSFLVPNNENGLLGTQWTEGKCFPTMGKHYWFNLTDNMPCLEIFPVFLLYNGGLLNAFGFAFTTEVTESRRFEHPPQDSYTKFMVSPPKCLGTAGTMSTIHVYKTDSIIRNQC